MEPKPYYPHSLSQQTPASEGSPVSAQLPWLQPITTLTAVLEAHFGRIPFANSPWKVSKWEIS